MIRRRQFIVDKKFQFKTTFSVITIVSLLTVLVIIAIASTIAYNNDKMHGIIQTEDQIFQALTAISSQQAKDPSYKTTVANMSRDHVNNFNIADRITQNNWLLIIALLIFIVIQGIVLYIMMILKTHRISGPIYVMSNYIKEMLNGKFPHPRPLRKKDELVDFYALFTELVDTLSKREIKKK
jgi:nitrate/nitrite-specific signal transduction histidine kinase